jgi:hypothetical protein
MSISGKYMLPDGFASGAITKSKKEEVTEIPVWAQARNKEESADEKKARKAEVCCKSIMHSGNIYSLDGYYRSRSIESIVAPKRSNHRKQSEL